MAATARAPVIALSAAIAMPKATLAGSCDRAVVVALTLGVVCAGRRARAGGVLTAGARGTARLRVSLAIAVMANLGADALPDAAAVPRGRVVAANLVRARGDYLGHATCQPYGVIAFGGGHGHDRPSADGQERRDEECSTLAEDA